MSRTLAQFSATVIPGMPIVAVGAEPPRDFRLLVKWVRKYPDGQVAAQVRENLTKMRKVGADV